MLTPHGTPHEGGRTSVAFAAVFAAFAAALIAYFADYGNWFIHPHQFEIHLHMLLGGDPSHRLRSVLNIFQQFDPTEARPRFLAYLIIWANLQLRMLLYDFFVLYPPFSLGWILELIIGPILLFRLMRNLTNAASAAWIALTVYVTSTGFLSGFSMALMPSKPLTNVVFIAVLWILSEAKRRAASNVGLNEIPGARKTMVVVGATLLCGLFLDEAPLYAFLLPVIFFPEFFFPAGLRTSTKAVLRSSAPILLPPLIFLAIVVLLLPPLTESLFGHRFDYIASVFVNHEAAETGKTFFSGKVYGFDWSSLWANFCSMFGGALVPWQLTGLARHPSGGGVVTGLSATPLLVAGATAMVAGFGWLAARGNARVAPMLWRTLIAALLFVLFMSLLSGRHVPYISGYVYGCGLAVFLAMLAGLCYAGAGSPTARRLIAACALLASVVQVNNFAAINRNWIEVHNEGLTRSSYQATFRLAPLGQRTTRDELNEVWRAWKDGLLDVYLDKHPISAGAVFLVFELRQRDKWRGGK